MTTHEQQRAALLDQLEASYDAMPPWGKVACLHALAAPNTNPDTGKPFSSFRQMLEAAADTTLETLREDFISNGELLGEPVLFSALAPEPEPARIVSVFVAGPAGCGKSTIAGAIEIALLSRGVPAVWENGPAEKGGPGADWPSDHDLYKPAVRIVEIQEPQGGPYTCAGCDSSDGFNHSAECQAEHAAAVAGGVFVKETAWEKLRAGHTTAPHGATHISGCGHFFLVPNLKDTEGPWGVWDGSAWVAPAAPEEVQEGPPTRLSHQQKLQALAYRYYQGMPWVPAAGDYYTTARDDLELYQVVKIEDGMVYTEYCTRPGEYTLWPEGEFTARGFGPLRVRVPPFVLGL